MADVSKIMQGIGKAPSLHLDRALAMPRFEIPRMPTEEEKHAYESSGALIRRLAITINMWRGQVPKDAQPVILAILANGTPVRVSRLVQEGHNGIIVDGKVGDSPCLVLAHQATLQLLCYVEQMQKPEKERAPIGFHYQGQEEDESQQPAGADPAGRGAAQP